MSGFDGNRYHSEVQGLTGFQRTGAFWGCCTGVLGSTPGAFHKDLASPSIESTLSIVVHSAHD